MKRIAFGILALLSVAGVGGLSAQDVRFGVGGGLVLPMGDYKDVDKLGWLVGADATYWLTGNAIGRRKSGERGRDLCLGVVRRRRSNCGASAAFGAA